MDNALNELQKLSKLFREKARGQGTALRNNVRSFISPIEKEHFLSAISDASFEDPLALHYKPRNFEEEYQSIMRQVKDHRELNPLYSLLCSLDTTSIKKKHKHVVRLLIDEVDNYNLKGSMIERAIKVPLEVVAELERKDAALQAAYRKGERTDQLESFADLIPQIEEIDAIWDGEVSLLLSPPPFYDNLKSYLYYDSGATDLGRKQEREWLQYGDYTSNYPQKEEFRLCGNLEPLHERLVQIAKCTDELFEAFKKIDLDQIDRVAVQKARAALEIFRSFQIDSSNLVIESSYFLDILESGRHYGEGSVCEAEEVVAIYNEAQKLTNLDTNVTKKYWVDTTNHVRAIKFFMAADNFICSLTEKVRGDSCLFEVDVDILNSFMPDVQEYISLEEQEEIGNILSSLIELSTRST